MESNIETKKVHVYRVVLEMDAEWFEEFAKLASYREPGEVLRWLSTDTVDVEINICTVCDQYADEDGYIEHDEWIHDNVDA